jgi:thioredoxin-like negative regulator of GroEL
MSLADIYLDYSVYNPQYVDKAIKLLEAGRDDSPKRLEIYSILARAYIDSNNMAKALEYLEQSLAIYDGREQDYINLTYFYFLARNDPKFDEYATKYINKFSNISVENYNKLISYYMNLVMPKELLDRGIIQRAIEQNPDNTSFKLALLDAYVGAKMKTEALDYISDIAKTDQIVANELTKYLKAIE